MIIYVDIDGTICNNTYGKYEEAKPRYDQISKINHLYMEGNEIVYWTARGGTTGKSWRTFTKRQIDNWGCQYTRIEIKRYKILSSNYSFIIRLVREFCEC